MQLAAASEKSGDALAKELMMPQGMDLSSLGNLAAVLGVSQGLNLLVNNQQGLALPLPRICLCAICHRVADQEEQLLAQLHNLIWPGALIGTLTQATLLRLSNNCSAPRSPCVAMLHMRFTSFLQGRCAGMGNGQSSLSQKLLSIATYSSANSVEVLVLRQLWQLCRCGQPTRPTQ